MKKINWKKIDKLQDRLVKAFKLETKRSYKRLLEGLGVLIVKKNKKDIEDFLLKELNTISKTQIKSLSNYLTVASNELVLNKKQIKKILKTRIKEVHFSDRIYKEKKKLKKAIIKDLSKIDFNKDNKREIIKTISKRLDISVSSAQRLVDTELSNVINQSILSNGHFYGKKMYKNVVTMDSRTSDICKKIHEEDKIYNIKDAKIGKTIGPFHPNCRTRIELL